MIDKDCPNNKLLNSSFDRQGDGDKTSGSLKRRPKDKVYVLNELNIFPIVVTTM